MIHSWNGYEERSSVKNYGFVFEVELRHLNIENVLYGQWTIIHSCVVAVLLEYNFSHK